ncbi:MAG TPA: family 78 glycoside hydrolase catalytic domain [Tepidisphaeraceae bacterium]|jgi:hypothetical protein
MNRVLLSVFASLVIGCSAPTVRNLRTEGRIAPLGIDAPQPRFSWLIDAGGKADHQTAYQILVASSADRLEFGKADLWDSGQVNSSENVNIPYAGKPLTSELHAAWKVRVWNGEGNASPWSDPTTFSVGLLDQKDWQAKWIGARDKRVRVAVNGYHATETRTDAPKWVQVDLQKPQQIDQIRLYPARPNNWKAQVPGFGFPPAGRVEVSDDAEFKQARIIGKWDDSKPLLHGDDAVTFDAKKTTARFIRVTSDHIWKREDGSLCFALAELEAISSGNNIAYGAPVTAKDSIDGTNGWGKNGLTDGQSPKVARKTEEDYAAPILRKTFKVEKPVARATLYLCGLGYAVPEINGKRVGEADLDPGFTNFHKRVLYVTHDVTKFLSTPNSPRSTTARSDRTQNVLAVTLGGGWYDVAQPELFGFEKAPWNAPAKMICRLNIEFTDGSKQAIVSDESWKRSTAEIVYNDIRAGETIDYNKTQPGWTTTSFDDSKWEPAVAVPAPAGKLVAQTHPPIKQLGEIPAVEVTEPQPGIYQFKLAENTAGWPKLRVTGAKGQKISIHCAEEFTREGGIARGLNQHTYGRYQTDEFILADHKPVTLTPHFTYHGFQYARIEGLKSKPSLADFSAIKVHTALEPAGEFQCSSDTINQIHDMCVRTYLCNLHGIPTDCPQREKAGWMADGLVSAPIGMWNFHADAIYTKWMRDMSDAQLPDGNVPSIIPNPGWGDLLDPWWGGATVMLPWDHYVRYHDDRILREQYPSMKKYLDYLTSRAKNHIVEFQLGDWLEVGAGSVANRTPVPLTSTIGYFRCAQVVASTAKLLGNNQDAKKYNELAATIKTAFNKKFFDEKNNRYGEDTQSAPAMALLFDLAPDDRRDQILAGLVDNITNKRKGHISTGLVATRYLIELLHAKNRDDLVYLMLMQKDFPGWIHMLNTGPAKTVWESWDGVASRNHPALGCVDMWFYEAIGGITPDPDAVCMNKITIAPQPLGDLTWARTSHNSPRGRIVSDWKINGSDFTLNVEVPVGTSATVVLPSKNGPERRPIEAGRYTFTTTFR